MQFENLHFESTNPSQEVHRHVDEIVPTRVATSDIGKVKGIRCECRCWQRCTRSWSGFTSGIQEPVQRQGNRSEEDGNAGSRGLMRSGYEKKGDVGGKLIFSSSIREQVTETIPWPSVGGPQAALVLPEGWFDGFGTRKNLRPGSGDRNVDSFFRFCFFHPDIPHPSSSPPPSSFLDASWMPSSRRPTPRLSPACGALELGSNTRSHRWKAFAPYCMEDELTRRFPSKG